jgi:hypothetical protein
MQEFVKKVLTKGKWYDNILKLSARAAKKCKSKRNLKKLEKSS